MATGWDNGLCQDYCKGLARWFSSRLDAREVVRRFHGDQTIKGHQVTPTTPASASVQSERLLHTIDREMVIQSVAAYFAASPVIETKVGHIWLSKADVLTVLRTLSQPAASQEATPASAEALHKGLIDMLEQFERVDFTGEKKAVIERAYAALDRYEVCRPDIIERLSYHAHERDDLTLDECLDVVATGWSKVHGRSERQMVMQIMALLAGQPATHPQQPSATGGDGKYFKREIGESGWMECTGLEYRRAQLDPQMDTMEEPASQPTSGAEATSADLTTRALHKALAVLERVHLDIMLADEMPAIGLLDALKLVRAALATPPAQQAADWTEPSDLLSHASDVADALEGFGDGKPKAHIHNQAAEVIRDLLRLVGESKPSQQADESIHPPSFVQAVQDAVEAETLALRQAYRDLSLDTVRKALDHADGRELICVVLNCEFHVPTVEGWEDKVRAHFSTSGDVLIIDPKIVIASPQSDKATAQQGVLVGYGKWAEGLPPGTRLLEHDGLPLVYRDPQPGFDVPLTTPQPSQQAATSGFVSVVPGSFVPNPEMSTEVPGLTKGEAAQYLGQRKAFEASQQARQPMTDAARDVLAERHRQITAEGWTPEHDDGHDPGELASASAAYALAAADEIHPLSQGDGGFDQEPPPMWPWDDEWWKPGASRRMLVKSCALALAEIERLDRASSPQAEKEGEA